MFNPDKLAAGEALTQISLSDRKIARGTRLSRELILSWRNAQQMHNLGVFKVFEVDPHLQPEPPPPKPTVRPAQTQTGKPPHQKQQVRR